MHKPIIRKFEKRKVYSSFKDNIWGADLADMQLISKFNEGFRFLLCVIDIFSKCAWVVPLRPNKIWVDKGSEFYNNSFKKWLKDNVIEMDSIHNE